MKYLFIFTCLALITGCAPSLQVSSYLAPEHKFNHKTTYYWSPYQEPVKLGNPSLDNTANRKLIKQAIDREMKRKGFILDSLKPDIFVEYFINIENKRSVITAPLPISDDFDMEYRVKVEEIKKGNFAIHIENSAHTKSLWIGSAEAIFEAEPIDTKHKINSTVKRIMLNLPSISKPSILEQKLSY